MWAWWALLAAFGWAASDVFVKKAMDRGEGGARILFVRYLVSIPLLLPLLAYGIPSLDRTFWLTHLWWPPLELTAIYLYVRAIRVSPLSLTVPFLAFTPLFLVLTGALLLGERVSGLGFAGIALVVVGSYTVNLTHARHDPLGPFKAMAREPGTRLMLAVAAIYSLTSLAGRILIDHSSPTYFAVHYAVLMTLITAPLALRQTARRKTPPQRVPLVLAGVMLAASVLGHMLSLQTAPTVAYMIAIKRLSGTFSVLFGWLFFKEQELSTRLIGSLIMVIGAALIIVG